MKTRFSRLGHWNLLTERSWLWLISLCCLSGRCLGQTYDGFSYSVSGMYITITSYTGSAGAVTIPSSIPGVDGTVTAIGDGAFLGCTNMTNLTIPSSVTAIGPQAFAGCSGLAAITVDPQNPSYSSVGGVLFDKNQATLVAWPLAEGGAYTIPDSVTSIGDYAFAMCSHLTSVNIPSSVTSIGNAAFLGCNGLTKVTIPSSVTTIADFAFGACSGLTAITVDPQNPFYSSLGGVLFDKNQTTLLQWPAGAAGAYAIPASVTSIGISAFGYCSNLTSVTIPGSVTTLEIAAFQNCYRLTSVSIPTSVTSIGWEAFWMCSGLTTITLDSQNPSYCSLGGVLFDKNRTTLVQWPPGVAGAYTIPSTVTSIGFMAFADCSNLTSVTIPSSVTAIMTMAFWECSHLTRAYFQGDPPSTFGYNVFDHTASGFSIYYPSTTTRWSTPIWHGYPARPYPYTPVPPQPLLTLVLGAGAVIPSFNSLQLGTSYQLQVSPDLSTWSSTGAVFTATNASEAYAPPFNVTQASRLFFRLVTSP